MSCQLTGTQDLSPRPHPVVDILAHGRPPSWTDRDRATFLSVYAPRIRGIWRIPGGPAMYTTCGLAHRPYFCLSVRCASHENSPVLALFRHRTSVIIRLVGSARSVRIGRASADTSDDQAGGALKSEWEIWKCKNDGPDPTRPNCGFWSYSSAQLSDHSLTKYERTRLPACWRSTHAPSRVATGAPA